MYWGAGIDGVEVDELLHKINGVVVLRQRVYGLLTCHLTL